MNSKIKKNSEPTGIKYARTCYDHIAGKAGVAITNSLIKKKIIIPVEKRYEVSKGGKKWFSSVDINIDDIQLQKRSFAHQCLDWSERKHHLAGALGSAMLRMMLQNDWIRRIKNSREILITAKGKRSIYEKLNLEI